MRDDTLEADQLVNLVRKLLMICLIRELFCIE